MIQFMVEDNTSETKTHLIAELGGTNFYNSPNFYHSPNSCSPRCCVLTVHKALPYSKVLVYRAWHVKKNVNDLWYSTYTLRTVHSGGAGKIRLQGVGSDFVHIDELLQILIENNHISVR